ncbi:hypothetical protein GWK47_019336 [Chionoecetes opilio]|uniref:Uncharacterized protein n=1 Tax=Chionoecetes opilio TaxID=41210 RepID=A0A8J4XQE4_CHIOP|nr:hypothetical protein GWK47_019336 [Chionoecetes opilio]
MTGIIHLTSMQWSVCSPHHEALETSMRVEVVWGGQVTWTTVSKISNQEEKRGKKVYERKVAGPDKVPGNWADCLRDPTNKETTFHSYQKKIVIHTSQTEKQVLQHLEPRSRSALTLDAAQVTTKRADTRMWSIYKMPLESGCHHRPWYAPGYDVLVILSGKVVSLLASKYHRLTFMGRFG